MAQLEAGKQAVNRDIDYWATRDVGITKIGVDVQANRVAVGVSSDLKVAQGALAARYGPIVVVADKAPTEPSSCTDNQHCAPPVVGGLYIIAQEVCTAGYVARSGSGALVLVTAGHCFHTSSDNWKNNPTTQTYIGTNNHYIMNHSTTSGTYPADAGYITIASGGMQATPHNKFLYATGSTTLWSVVGYAGSNYYPNGTLVCKSGVASGWTCGIILGQEETLVEGSVRIQHVEEVNAFGARGDSGGPVFYGTSSVVLLGIEIAIGPNNTSPPFYYSPVNVIDSSLGVAPCITATC